MKRRFNQEQFEAKLHALPIAILKLLDELRRLDAAINCCGIIACPVCDNSGVIAGDYCLLCEGNGIILKELQKYMEG